MTPSPLYQRGYRDALAKRGRHEQLQFTWGYRMGYADGTAARLSCEDLKAA